MGFTLISLALTILYFVLAALSFLVNTAVVVDICKDGYPSILSTLTLYLHISQILEDIAFLPVYSDNVYKCQFFGFLGVYSALSNMAAIFCIVWSTFQLLFPHVACLRFKELPKEKIFKTALIFGFPLFGILPFISADIYGVFETYWCFLDLNSKIGEYWGIAIFLIPGVWMLLYTLATSIYIMWKLQRLPDVQMNFFKSIGVYILVNGFIWIFRVALRIAPNRDASNGLYLAFWAFLLPYFAGICSAFAYLQGKKSFSSYNRWFQSNGDLDDSSYGTNFTGTNHCITYKFYSRIVIESCVNICTVNARVTC